MHVLGAASPCSLPRPGPGGRSRSCDEREDLRLRSGGLPQADRAAGTIDPHGCRAAGGLAGFHEAGDLPVLEGDGARPVSSGMTPSITPASHPCSSPCPGLTASVRPVPPRSSQSFLPGHKGPQRLPTVPAGVHPPGCPGKREETPPVSGASLTTWPPTGVQDSAAESMVQAPGTRDRAVLTRHSQAVHTSRCHRAPSAWGSPSTSVHSAVLSRDSSFFICKANVCTVSPRECGPRPARPGGSNSSPDS